MEPEIWRHGDWHFANAGAGYGRVIQGPQGQSIALVYGNSQNPDDPEKERIARMIAATPQMAAALTLLVDIAEKIHTWDGDDEEQRKAAVEFGQALLNKIRPR